MVNMVSDGEKKEVETVLLVKIFLSFFKCFKNRNSQQFAFLYLSAVCESHLSVFVPSNYTEKGLKAGPVVGMNIYMNPRIIVMKGRRKDSDRIKLQVV